MLGVEILTQTCKMSHCLHKHITDTNLPPIKHVKSLLNLSFMYNFLKHHLPLSLYYIKLLHFTHFSPVLPPFTPNLPITNLSKCQDMEKFTSNSKKLHKWCLWHFAILSKLLSEPSQGVHLSISLYIWNRKKFNKS